MLIGINGKIDSGKDTLGDLIQYQMYLPKLFKYTSLGDRSTMTNPKSEAFELWNTGGTETNKSVLSGVQIKKFATALRKIMEALTGIPAYKFEDRNLKNTIAPRMWNRTIGEAREWLMIKYFQREHSMSKPLGLSSDKEIRQWAIQEGFKFQRTYREMLQEIGTETMRNNFHPDVWLNALLGQYTGYYEGEGTEMIYPNWIITDVRFPNEAEAVKKHGGLLIRIDGVSVTDTHLSEIALDDYDGFDYRVINHYKAGTMNKEDSLASFANDAMSIVNHFKLTEYAGTNRRPEPIKPRSEEYPQ